MRDQHILKLVFSASALVLLAACATTPQTALPLPAASSSPVAAPAAAPGDRVEAAPPALPPLVAETPPKPQLPADSELVEFQRGSASWYGNRFHKRRTASGEVYDMHGFTAAHRSLPFGTVVRVRSLVNGREVEVRINDRGPFTRTRIIDVSRAAADELGMLGLGIKDVVLLVPASTPTLEELPAPARRAKASRPKTR